MKLNLIFLLLHVVQKKVIYKNNNWRICLLKTTNECHFDFKREKRGKVAIHIWTKCFFLSTKFSSFAPCLWQWKRVERLLKNLVILIFFYQIFNCNFFLLFLSYCGKHNYYKNGYFTKQNYWTDHRIPKEIMFWTCLIVYCKIKIWGIWICFHRNNTNQTKIQCNVGIFNEKPSWLYY